MKIRGKSNYNSMMLICKMLDKPDQVGLYVGDTERGVRDIANVLRAFGVRCKKNMMTNDITFDNGSVIKFHDPRRDDDELRCLEISDSLIEGDVDENLKWMVKYRTRL